MPLETLVVLLLGVALTACGPGETTNHDTEQPADAGDTDSTELSLCNPLSPECGGQGWQFESDARCPEAPAMPTTSCSAPTAACYYCEDPELAASEAGHPFEIRACDPNTETWQVQELTCSTE
ncbi:MAG: hypothetical protein ACQEVA_06935 [Myxococcota bacterium]